MRPAASLLLVLAVSGARGSSAAVAFADKNALKTAIDNCLTKVPTGFECCSRAVDPAACGVAGTTDMPGWNVALVTDMGSLFKAKKQFNQNIGGWDVSVTDMNTMFYQANEFPGQDLGSWDVSR
jgi:hypothetical protein